MDATPHHTDEPGSGQIHGEKGPAHHGVLDMGFDEDKPQELPGMEVDVITADEIEFKDLMKTMTRDECSPRTGRRPAEVQDR